MTLGEMYLQDCARELDDGNLDAAKMSFQAFYVISTPASSLSAHNICEVEFTESSSIVIHLPYGKIDWDTITAEHYPPQAC